MGDQPQTFLERGVVIPYTTPALLGARLRQGGRVARELIVPNIAGGAGVYMLALDVAHTLCQPTLHDRALNARLGDLDAISPEAVRTLSFKVAAEGLAGVGAARSARAALADERQQTIQATRHILIRLLHQVEPRGPGWIPPEQAEANQFLDRVHDTLAALAPRVGCDAERMTAMIEQLGRQFRRVGVGEHERRSPVAELIETVSRLSAGLRHAVPRLEIDVVLAAETIATMGRQTADAATVSIHDARALLADLPELLSRWAAEPEQVASLITRPDWLLDGWERICLVWQAGEEPADPSRTVLEMLDMVPPIPLEAALWLDGRAPLPQDPAKRRRRMPGRPDWRRGATIVDQIERNERLAAMAAGAHA